jgi:hypothetical protein
MERHTIHLVSPGGAELAVSLPAAPVLTGVVARVRFAGGSFGRDFAIGPPGYHAGALRDLMPGAVNTQRFLAHGREVVLAEAPAGGAIATLLGDYHELMTVFGGPPPGPDRLVDLFESLELDDRPEGMVVRASRPTLLGATNEMVFVVVRGRGQVAVPGLDTAASLRPGHRGLPTRHGELWRWLPQDAAGTGVAAYQYVYGGPRGMAEVSLDADGTASDAELLAWLDELDVAWTN